MSVHHSHHSREWLHHLSAHMHIPHLHHLHGRTTLLPISTDSENQWDLSVPEQLVKGTRMTKVSRKQHKQLTVSIDPDEGRILYTSRVCGIIPIEAIKELRMGAEGSYYREQFFLPPSYDERWISVIYIRDGEYKAAHFVAPTMDVFDLWETCLRRLNSVRQGLMQGLGNLEVREQLWERMYWKEADKKGDRKLDVPEMKKLCLRLGVNLSKQEIKALFRQADSQGRGYLEYQEFKEFVKILKRRPEIEGIHSKLCASNDGHFDLSVFKHFMREFQNSKLSDMELESIFDIYTDTKIVDDVTSASAGSNVMTIEHFRTFLLSSNNSPFSEEDTIWQDMTRPMPEYYISSSHNTYLVGSQLVGVSTIEGYIRALLHSCRTVEMDIYDGLVGEPVVYHGKTLTSRVSVRDICHAIAKYAFVTSPYPVMISAEIHCNVKQQEKMVEIMCDIFGDALIRAPADGTAVKIDTLPSPEALKGKILVKAKNPSVNHQLAEVQARRLAEVLAAEKAANTSDSESSSEGTSGSEVSIIHSIFHRVRSRNKHRQHAVPVAVHSTSTLSLGGNSVDVAQNTGAKAPMVSASAKPKLSGALASLLVYAVGVSCHGVGTAAHVNYAPEHTFSLSERTANKLLKSRTFDEPTLPFPNTRANEAPRNQESGDPSVAMDSSSPVLCTKEQHGARTGMWELIKHNQDHLTRIYPKGTRVNSSNFQPHRYWAAGSQLVAINWQTFDLGYMINQSMFRRNGKSGYVLKPAPLRRPDNEELLSRRTEHFLEMTIISAQQLPRSRDRTDQAMGNKSVLDPFVQVSLHIPDWTDSRFLPPAVPGVLHETTHHSVPTERATTAAQASSARTVTVRTRTIGGNGFNPVWNEDLCIPFDCVGGREMRELIFVEVKVCQEGKEAGWEPIGVYCTPLGCLAQGFRHFPLHDSQLSQHLFATLFVQIRIRDA
ncbi:hypothetical protein APHAL10511_001425 [Amanita phalloides]|nr:hypothetical protein APHAL10511_001425 [Amanita phalloides]